MRHQLLTGTTSDIKQFVGDSLLTSLVVLQVEFTQQLIGIIGGCLHGNHTGCVLRGIVVEQSRVEQAASRSLSLYPTGAHHASSDTPAIPS